MYLGFFLSDYKGFIALAVFCMHSLNVRQSISRKNKLSSTAHVLFRKLFLAMKGSSMPSLQTSNSSPSLQLVSNSSLSLQSIPNPQSLYHSQVHRMECQVYLVDSLIDWVIYLPLLINIILRFLFTLILYLTLIINCFLDFLISWSIFCVLIYWLIHILLQEALNLFSSIGFPNYIESFAVDPNEILRNS